MNSDGHDMRVKLYDPNGNTVYNKVRVNIYFQKSKIKLGKPKCDKNSFYCA